METDKKPFDFNVFAGSEVGFLKGINFNPKSVITKNFSRANLKENELRVASMVWDDATDEEEIVVGFQNQTVATFDTTCNYYTSSRHLQSGKGPLVSVVKAPGITVTGLKSGEVSVWKGVDCSTIETVTGNEYSDKRKTPPTLSCMKGNPTDRNQVATGGCENDLAVWDLNITNKSIFQAKNVKADMLELRVPVWVSDLTYLPSSCNIALCTRHKHIRLYDPQTQRRPVISFEWEDSPLTAIAPVYSRDRQVVVGSGEGKMALFDLRRVASSKPVHIFKNLIGAITDIVVHPSLPLVFSVSLDRFIRVHHLNQREALLKHYLKSRINCLLVRNRLNEVDFGLSDPTGGANPAVCGERTEAAIAAHRKKRKRD